MVVIGCYPTLCFVQPDWVRRKENPLILGTGAQFLLRSVMSGPVSFMQVDRDVLKDKFVIDTRGAW